MPGDHVQNHLRSPNPMHLCSSELGEDLLSTLPFFDDSNRRGKGRLRMRFKLNHHLLWLYQIISSPEENGGFALLTQCNTRWRNRGIRHDHPAESEHKILQTRSRGIITCSPDRVHRVHYYTLSSFGGSCIVVRGLAPLMSGQKWYVTLAALAGRPGCRRWPGRCSERGLHGCQIREQPLRVSRDRLGRSSLLAARQGAHRSVHKCADQAWQFLPRGSK